MKINASVVREEWARAEVLVLCKHELFFQDRNADHIEWEDDEGNKHESLYPVGKYAAMLIAHFLDKELEYV